ncbi:hypothetical protein VTH06DRAFT_8831 [Thermothelomyces fergusii]
MAPPTAPLNLDVEAISGICGSISIACWVVVFSPQIIENLRRGGADGLSVQFVVVWLLGDVFNILGAVLQRVLPTMLILAVYYTVADVVLLLQCFYYRGFTLTDHHDVAVVVGGAPPAPEPEPGPGPAPAPKPMPMPMPMPKQQQGAERTRNGPDERTGLLRDPPAAHHHEWPSYHSFEDRERRGPGRTCRRPCRS